MIEHFSANIEGKVAIIAIDLHPWNSLVNLSFLTEEELVSDPLLAEAEEMAAWKFFDYSSQHDYWNSGEIIDCLGLEGDHFTSASKALCSDSVRVSLGKLDKVVDFKLSVVHPDTNLEYVNSN